MRRKYIMGKIPNCLIILLIILSSIIPSLGANNNYSNNNTLYNNPYIKLINSNYNFINHYNTESRNVLIELDINGIAYGHELLWKANTTGTNYEESSVAYLDGIAYIGSCSTHGAGHDKVFAVDTTNGEILWSYSIGPGYVGPIIDNDRIYIGTSSHGYDPSNEYIYAINRYNGTEIWNRNIYGGIPESIQFDDDKIYFTSDKIYALDKNNGEINWTYQMDSFSVTKPILKDNAFYTATSGGKMYKVNKTDGEKIWEISLSDFSWDNSITADGEGQIYLSLYGDKTINAYNENDGSLIWSYRLNGRSLSFNAYHNNRIYISDTSGFVYAFNSSTGSLIWENKIGNIIDISSPTLSDNLLLIGTRDFNEGAFFALNITNGNVLWKYTVGASVTAPPSIVDGMMLCGTDDWNMYAFDFGIGSGNWILSRHDSSNTAYSPNGITTWQYVSTSCTTEKNVTTCTINNNYDHDVNNVELKLTENRNSNWYDSYGNLLKSESNNYTIDALSSTSSLILIITQNQIHPPNKPSIDGPTYCKPFTSYEYKISTSDIDGDDIYYYIDWGDGSDSSWLGPYNSGEEITKSHSWQNKGSYTIRVKAKDVFDAESEWATIEISIPRNKINTLFWSLLFERFQIFERFIKNPNENKNNNDEVEYWALLIAVGEYLNNSNQDRPSMLIQVENLYQTILDSNNWDLNHIKKIKGKNATFSNIIEGFLWLDQNENKGDISLIYITTHGFPLPIDIWPYDENDGYDEALVPYEGFDDTSKFIWDDLLNFYLSLYESDGICIIVDSCYSGGFNDESYAKSYRKLNNRIFNPIKNPVINYNSNLFIKGIIEDISSNGRVVLMSSEENEVSYGSHFSQYIIKGLQGNADDNMDDICSAEEAFYYAKPLVEKLGMQHPTILDAYIGELGLIML